MDTDRDRSGELRLRKLNEAPERGDIASESARA
jgi:hypothetical protein